MSSDRNNAWDHREIYEILDLCISCKGCKSECPSGVDIAKLKAEFMQHWYDRHGIPLRTLLIAHITKINRIGSVFPAFFNMLVTNSFISGLIKKLVGFASLRSIPTLGKITLRRWIRRNIEKHNPDNPKGTVCLFIDEFTNYNDTGTGIAAVKLLTLLGYRIITVSHSESARTFLSKGLLRNARKIARKNLSALSGVISEKVPLVGIEPSAILAFRDEYPELSGSDYRAVAETIAANSFMVDEFIAREYRAGRIERNSFTDEESFIVVHAHCQQKAIITSAPTLEMLSIPVNYKVREIPSGCCGMAGSFGYEKEHYELSNRIGELVLFPEIREAAAEVLIAAPGTSCRHHIKDGTGRKAVHPVEILYWALKQNRH
jgi:Fe-S oxidoreductase